MRELRKRDVQVAGLTGLALVLMVCTYFVPIWWVALSAPNYPAEAFPQGIRIEFHFDGVYNGCRVAPTGSRRQSEVLQQDLDGAVERYNPILNAHQNVNEGAAGLDCLHEMNTINHYVGMFPIASGAPVERVVAKYIFGFLAVMLLAFGVPEARRCQRLPVLIVGFALVTGWALIDQFLLGHLNAYIGQYVRDSAAYFNEPARIALWGANVRLIIQIVLASLVTAMALVVVGVARSRRFMLLLAVVPSLLPLFFLVDYAAWLWVFGHHLHPWGAFTVKPFMPTVFGEGKVAQFSTFSYPYWGYALLLLLWACLTLAALLRRQQLSLASGVGSNADHQC